MARDNQAGKSFMQRLLHDITANTLAIAAASLMPLLAMVGGGIDASRYYMAAARLQSACDAGALAARQAMATDTFTGAHRQVGENFFDNNFHDGIFGTTNRARSFSANASGVVTGTASATMPTTIMSAFGYTSFALAATCSAEVNISNTDIMFVLDVTGSMACAPNGSNCSSGSDSKIVALRSAVVSFYDTVQAATSPEAQVRYGVVPYSQQVNVGFSIPPAHMASNAVYQSRVPRYTTQVTTIPGNGVRIGDPIVISNVEENIPLSLDNLGSLTESHYYFRNRSNNDNRANDTDKELCEVSHRTTRTVGTETWTISATLYRLQQYPLAPQATRAGCRGMVRKTRPATQADVIPDRTETTFVFRDWMYCQVTTGTTNPCNVNNPAGSPEPWASVNLRTAYDSARTVQLPLGANGTMTNITWEGCIEEPDTVSTDNYSPIPAGSHDLNVNLVPANESQRWKPALGGWNGAVWQRWNGSGNPSMAAVTDADRIAGGRSTDQPRPGWSCPVPARKLAAITKTDLQTYVNGLIPTGQTYHDIGMLWGTRFLSPRGIFASENAAAPNGDPIARHIVFMTDGEQVNSNGNYSTHGVEWWDRRITGTGDGGTEFSRRAARLQAICRAAQQENITVWVVAFGTALNSALTTCASPGRAFQANDSTTLQARFQEIAQKIAALRLTS